MAADALFAKNGTNIVLLDVEKSFFLSDLFVIANRFVVVSTSRHWPTMSRSGSVRSST